MNYKKLAEEVKGKSIFDDFAGCYVDAFDMTNEQRKDLGIDDTPDEADDAWYPFSYNDIYANDLENIAQFDDYYVEEDYINGFLKKANNYLVYASGCRWDGASGFKFAKSVVEALARDYDVTFYVVDISPKGKILTLSESSHDVPMGSITHVIALTDREYYDLAEYEDFDKVKRFVKRTVK